MPVLEVERSTIAERASVVEGRRMPNIVAASGELKGLIKTNDVVVLKGHTGSGKSVFGPWIFLEGIQELHPERNVRMLVGEPTQLLAKEVSSDAAGAAGETHGGKIGFYHGNDRNMSDETQLVYTVYQSISNRLQEDITLSGFDAVFLDEIHMRRTDQYEVRMGLMKCNEERDKLGIPRLKIIIASADATKEDGDFHGTTAVKEIEGRKARHVEIKYSPKKIAPKDIPEEMGRHAAELVLRDGSGDGLVFLAGKAQIDRGMEAFKQYMVEKGLSEEYRCYRLTGGGGDENQAVQKLLADGIKDRKPVVAFVTDVAETGATFPGVTFVKDGMVVTVSIVDPKTGLERFEVVNISQMQIKQRLGRLGRGEYDGEYYTADTEAEFNDPRRHRAETIPLILQADLASLILSLKKMGYDDVFSINFPEPPGKEQLRPQLQQAVKTLTLLGALEPDGTLTDEGKEMLKIPYEPHTARMIIEAKKQGTVEAAAVIAGFLDNENSVFSLQKGEDFKMKYGEFIVPGSDILTMLKVWNAYIAEPSGNREAWAVRKGIQESVLKNVIKLKDTLARDRSLQNTDLIREHKVINYAAQAASIEKSFIAGFGDRLLEREGTNIYKMAVGKQRGIIPAATSVVSTASLPGFMVSGSIRVGRMNVSSAINHEVSRDVYTEVAGRLAMIEAAMEASEATHAVTAVTNIVRENAERTRLDTVRPAEE